MASDIRKPLPAHVDVRVKYSAGTYQTQTVRGQRASSTSSPEYAAKTLATKLWTDRAAKITQLLAKGLPAGVTKWRLEA